MKKILIIVLCLIISGAIFVKVQYETAINKPLKIHGDILYTVKQGDTFYSVLESLENDKVIVNTYFIKYYLRKNNIITDIKPGEYNLSSELSLINFIELLSKGNLNKNEVSVTIQEGKNIEEIGEILESSGILSKESFIESCKNYELPKYIKNEGNRRYALEGFLFPDTYRFIKGTDGNAVIKTMLSRFEEIISEIEKENNINIDDVDKITTIAALIEKEVSTSSERTLVASVINNRLEKGMMLQIDATVLYALGKHKEKVLYKDLEVNSPYNTYKVIGLPVGPIGCPGKDSIAAAVNPSKTNYLYYVSNNDGTHFFTDNYNKFLKVKKETQGF